MANKATYALGELIKITKRKCSDKIQPKIKEGGLYLVLEEDKPTKSGAKVLIISEFSKMAYMSIVSPNKYIDTKDMMRCNSDRFEWQKKSQSYLKAEYEKEKASYIKKQEEMQDKQIKEKFTDKERVQLAYTPYLYAELAWYYAYKVTDLAISRRVESLKKRTRTIKSLRADFLFELKRKMSQPVLDAAQKKVTDAIANNSLDFLKFELSVQNEINKQYKGSSDNDIRAFAYISMLCYEAQRRVDIANIHLINHRIGGVAEEVESYKYMRELYTEMKGCMGVFRIEQTLPIQTAVKIMEKTIGSMTL